MNNLFLLQWSSSSGLQTAFDVCFELQRDSSPHCLVELYRPFGAQSTTTAAPRSVATMVTLAPPTDLSGFLDDATMEYVFVLDRSKSMEGSVLTALQSALAPALTSLFTGCDFVCEIAFFPSHELQCGYVIGVDSRSSRSGRIALCCSRMAQPLSHLPVFRSPRSSFVISKQITVRVGVRMWVVLRRTWCALGAF
jgi:hypothetical protein